MAGRKSKTATAAKPKRQAKAGGKTAAKANPARSKNDRAVDHVVAAAKSIKKSAVKAKSKQSTASQSPSMGGIHDELERLAAYIDAAKAEIAAIRPHDVKEEYLPSASDELDAIVEATADATNTIMDSCEMVEGVIGQVEAEVSNALTDATTRIYEACTFQDITGQRIGKVVKALKNIEDRIDALLQTFGDEEFKPKRNKAKATPKKTTVTDEDLLEGPQLGDKAKSQAEIDDLLASFD